MNYGLLCLSSVTLASFTWVITVRQHANTILFGKGPESLGFVHLLIH